MCFRTKLVLLHNKRKLWVLKSGTKMFWTFWETFSWFLFLSVQVHCVCIKYDFIRCCVSFIRLWVLTGWQCIDKFYKSLSKFNFVYNIYENSNILSYIKLHYGSHLPLIKCIKSYKGGKYCSIQEVFGLGNEEQTAPAQWCFSAVLKSLTLSLRFCHVRFNQQDSIVKGRKKTGWVLRRQMFQFTLIWNKTSLIFVSVTALPALSSCGLIGLAFQKEWRGNIRK